MTRCSGFLVAAVCLASVSRADVSRGQASVVNAVYRADVPFPQFLPLWLEAWSQMAAAGESLESIQAKNPLGGYIHVYLRNPGSQPIDVSDVQLDGVSLAKALVFAKEKTSGFNPASIRFARLPQPDLDRLIAAGEPVWWKADPASVVGGGFGEVVIRLRHAPKAGAVTVKIMAADTPVEARVDAARPQPTFCGISFSPALDHVFLYVRHSGNAGIAASRVLIDGEDVTSRSTIAADKAVDIAPIVTRLNKPLARGSFHCFQAVCPDGSTAVAGTRAFGDELVYGMWGYTNSGSDPERNARDCLTNLANHNINVHMESIGKWEPFISTKAGFDFLESIGIRRMVKWIGNTRNPMYYFLMDEPDAHDYAVNRLPADERLGTLAQPLVEQGKLLRRKDPTTAQLLNIDNTYKPENYYTYAQLPDVVCADPYYQEQLSNRYNQRAGWLGHFTKATSVYGSALICRTAGAPKPLHIILNSVRHRGQKNAFRMATPPEKRIELYYALAAGAKGISYWWFCPYDEFYGVGGNDEDAKILWKEIGLLGAEARTAGPVITRGCPATVPVKGSKYLWVRALLAGQDTLVLIVVNDNYANDRVGTVIFPAEKASVTVTPPSWLQVKDAFEVTYHGIRDLTWKPAGPQVAFDLGKVEVTRLIMLSSDPQLRSQLSGLYETRFAAKVAKLLGR
jgi:hypothetical protein